MQEDIISYGLRIGYFRKTKEGTEFNPESNISYGELERDYRQQILGIGFNKIKSRKK